LIERWRNEAVRAGRPISRIALAYEAGRDGFWLARWLIARGIEAHVIHSASVAVSRERKRAKTDRLDAAIRDTLIEGFSHFVTSDCSDCFRLERLPGGVCTHWKAPPYHGAHPERTLFPRAHGRGIAGNSVRRSGLVFLALALAGERA
jgi:hypothetical protein